VTAQMYAFVLYQGGHEARNDNGPLLLGDLDLDPQWAGVTRRRLNGYLAGELRRRGIREDQWDEYELWVFPLGRDQGPARNATFRWAFTPDDPHGEESPR
jgi:hypothetical protein